MNIEITHVFIIGSNAFFSDFPDFASKDTDIIYLINYPFFGDKIMNSNNDGKDIFYMYNFGKEKLLNKCLKSNFPMSAGKFLVKEFAEHIGLTIDDLKLLKKMFDKMDNNHAYEKIIYDSYIENNDFYLTESQLNRAYKEYKKYR